MGIFFAFLMFFLLMGVISVFGYLHYVKPSRLLDQLATTTSDAIPARLTEQKRKDGFSFGQLFIPIGNLLPVSPQDASATREELVAAGFRSSSSVAVFYGVKIVLATVLVLLALMFREKLSTNPLLHIVMPVAGGGIGYFLPAFILGRLAKRRRERIRFSLPDVLDLMVVCTEAGCGLDQAIVNVSRELKTVHPDIAEELKIVNMEIMAGKSRADALRNLGRHTAEEETKKLVAILIQTDRFGTSMGEALRTQSDFLRIRRRQEAEERAGKVGVKLVFPIFFFCLPALLVVTAGPGILQLFNNLFPIMNSFR
ncbi:MAG: type II secretion system F family protein [Acidobacteriaceae bacterium]|nr:type II secretion system F family protein [Acidobacteriaceae bacterium]MBV9294609.1 type II secretion system F family protein [Acidobacteriaceae bacterium]MBV9764434.1 type II secretion system F family protein [Acidobacteriaceae bacterium]